MQHYISTSLFNPVGTSGSISLTSLSPVKFEYINANANITIPYKTLAFKDGFKLFYNKAQENIKDVAITKNTLFQLTDNLLWKDILQENKKNISRLDNFGFFYGYIQNQTSAENQYSFLQINSNNELAVSENSKALVKFTKLPNNKTQITFLKNQEEIELVVQKDPIYNTYTLKGVPKGEYNSNYIREFNIKLTNEFITISYEDYLYDKYTIGDLALIQPIVYSSNQQIERYIGIRNNKLFSAGIGFNFSTSIYNASKYNDDINIFKSFTFKIVNEKYEPIVFGINPNSQNLWVSYYNSIFDKSHNKDVDVNLNSSIFDVPINYLLVSNYKFNDATTLKLNVIPLKTIYSVENELIKSSNIYLNGEYLNNVEKPLQPIQRSYTKLFITNNDIQEYDKVFLGFSAGTKNIKIKADANTYFHYPIQGAPLLIENSNLIQSGAIAGPSPHLADKLFTKNTNYGRDNVWGHQQPPIECTDGVFLCTWLSGTNNIDSSTINQSIWMDRWYEGSTVTEISALFTSVNQLSSNNLSVKIYDTPSNIPLNPGGYYYYNHVGNNTIKQYIESLNFLTTSLRLKIEATSSAVKDKSNYNNNIDFYKQSSSVFLQDSPDIELPDNFSINLQDYNFLKIQNNSILDLPHDFTTGFWIKSEDWNNNPGNPIVDNSFRGGWSFNLNNGFYNPVIAIGETTYGHIPCITTDLRTYTDNVLPPLSGPYLDPNSVIVTEDLFVFAFDKINKTLLKYEYNGDLIDLVSFNSYTQSISNSKLLYSEDKKIYLHFNNNLYITDTEFKASSSINLPYTNFVLDLNNNVIGGNFKDAVIDNFNTLWYISACPASFFTSSFFESTDTNTHLLTSSQSLNYLFYKKEGVTYPVKITDFNNKDITRAVLFPNSIHDYTNNLGTLLSKPFAPAKLNIDNENNLYCLNDNSELLKLVVNSLNEAGFVYKKSITFKETQSGLNFSYISPSVISQYNQTIRDNSYNDLFLINQTKDYWSTSLFTDNYFNLSYEFNEILKKYETYIYFIDNKANTLNKIDRNLSLLTNIKLMNTFDPFVANEIDKNTIKFNNIYTGYDWHRKYNYLKINKQPRIEFNFTTIFNNNKQKYNLFIPPSLLINNEWHHITATLSKQENKAKLYFNGKVVDDVTVSSSETIPYFYKNDISVGCPILRSESLLEELGTNDYIFTGKIKDIFLYDYSLSNSSISYLIYDQYKIHDINWNIDIGSKNYIEQIEKFYKNKTPGNKSCLFDIHLLNTTDVSLDTKKIVERIINTAVKEVAPSHTKLNKIKWF